MPRNEIAFTPLASPSAPRHTPLFPKVLDQNSVLGDTETLPRRNRKVETGKLVPTPESGVDTVFDIVERGAQRFGDAPALGTRPNLKSFKQHQELANIQNGNGAPKPRQGQWSMFEKGPYEWISYREYALLVRQIGAGYRKLGMSRGDKLHIYAATRLVDRESFSLAFQSPVHFFDCLIENGRRTLCSTTTLTSLSIENIITDWGQ